MDKILRIIDANFNRAREGLRVIEDAVRFYYEFESGHIKELKEARHSLAKAVTKNFAPLSLKTARNSVCDRGKILDARKKEDVAKIVEKNFFRTGEALRTIEEYSKTAAPGASMVFHNLRFKLYSIERELSLKIHRKKLPVPFICIAVSFSEKDKNFIDSIKQYIGVKPNVLELHYEGNRSGKFLGLAKQARKLIPKDIVYIIKERADICKLCNADGIRIGPQDIPLHETRKLLLDKIIGFSVKELKNISRFSEKDVDYFFYAPAKQPAKTAILTESMKKVNIPTVFFLKDGSKGKIESLIKQGASGIAIGTETKTHKQVCNLIREIKKGIKKHGQ